MCVYVRARVLVGTFRALVVLAMVTPLCYTVTQLLLVTILAVDTLFMTRPEGFAHCLSLPRMCGHAIVTILAFIVFLPDLDLNEMNQMNVHEKACASTRRSLGSWKGTEEQECVCLQHSRWR
jgi:hypothetical protein